MGAQKIQKISQKSPRRSKSNEVHEVSHLLEYIGLVHVYNVVNENDPSYKKVVKTIEKLKWELDDSCLEEQLFGNYWCRDPRKAHSGASLFRPRFTH